MEEWRKGGELWTMFFDFFNICKSLWKTECSQDYWQKVIRDTHDFTVKYGETKFVVDLALALVNELERREKDAKHKTNDRSTT